jgi:hypothetical protein
MRGERGQSLILALLVMFLLVFIGGVFITLIARNIGRTRRSGEVLSADYLAEAGIRYADDQLTYGRDGADWRPIPDYPGVLNDPPVPPLPLPQDPDYTWLMQGFSRFNYAKGRFLIRVTYDPNRDDPLSKYIKIESVGRMGTVDPNDPTTYALRQPMRLRKEKVAYKAIGITDYARFVTNKDRRTGELSLGAPKFITSFGEQLTSGEIRGAPIRVNGDLLWHGKNFVWLDSRRGDAVEVAGDIRHDVHGDPTAPGSEVTQVFVNTAPVRESSDRNFDTSPADPLAELGKYRDGSAEPDVSQRPRSIVRLEPPILDSQGPSGGLGRYRELTRNSGVWKRDPDRNWFNTGLYGWGQGIYINNREDIQSQAELRGDWTQPGGPNWLGPYYTPPGLIIILHPFDLDNADGDNNIMTGPDLLLRRPSPEGRAKYNWYDQDGNLLAAAGETLLMPYPKNGVLFAEGNVRIKGTLPPGVQLTVVSGGTIYIEGNILKYPRDYQRSDPSLPPPPDTPLIDVEQPKDSAIALLATDYVCVNTTRFFGPTGNVPMLGEGGYFDVPSQGAFSVEFAFGLDPVLAYGNSVPLGLYVRHTCDPDVGASFVNLLVNWPPTAQEKASNPFYALYKFWDGKPDPLDDYIYRVGEPAAGQKLWVWENAVFQLLPVTNGAQYNVYTDPGIRNELGFQLDQIGAKDVGLQDYYLSRIAVQPCDIRIEALLFAQNYSFFVIPGDWFNPEADDTSDRFAALNTRPRPGVNDRWPFYGEPLDVRIVVYGAVSENLPAAIGDSSAWMEKWGWMPPQHGSMASETTVSYRSPLDPSQSEDALVEQRGLTFVYDSQLSYPKVPGPGNAAQDVPVRMDSFGRTLPIAPRLPVSPQTLYFGEPT